MNRKNLETLYNLLPDIYRQRDAQQGGVLRALLAIMEKELQSMESEIATSYANCFIETCDEKVIPYISRLLGFNELNEERCNIIHQRSYVANTIRYRRRKGRIDTLEHLIADVTGWRVKLVEFYDLLSLTQHIRYPRPGKGTLARISSLNTLNTAFDENAHTFEVRNSHRHSAKYNLSTVGLYLWRLQVYSIEKCTAYRVKKGCYTFHPCGIDMPLFKIPRMADDLSQRDVEADLPVMVQSAALAHDLKRHQNHSRSLLDNIDQKKNNYYGPEGSFCLTKVVPEPGGEKDEVIESDKIVVMDLSQWPKIPADKMAIDVTLGRFALGKNEINKGVSIRADYHYGFSADIGGGHYDRIDSLAILDNDTKLILVSQSQKDQSQKEECSTLTEAIAKWEEEDHSGKTVIQINDDGLYEITEEIKLENESCLVIQASNGARPCIHLPDGFTVIADEKSNQNEKSKQILLSGLLIDGKMTLKGNVCCTLSHTTIIPKKDSCAIFVADETKKDTETEKDMVPNRQINIIIEYSIVGSLGVSEMIDCLTIRNSIVDGVQGLAIRGPRTLVGFNHYMMLNKAKPDSKDKKPGIYLYRTGEAEQVFALIVYSQTLSEILDLSKIRKTSVQESLLKELIWPDDGVDDNRIATKIPEKLVNLIASNCERINGPRTFLERTTVFGSINVLEFSLISESIITEKAIAKRVQTGGVRYSSIPLGSETPPHFRCQPELAYETIAKKRAAELGIELVENLPETEKELILAQLTPRFSSTRYGDPSYAQLSQQCNKAIRWGAEGGYEMGVFYHLKQPQREANLRGILEEYLPFGLVSQLFYVN